MKKIALLLCSLLLFASPAYAQQVNIALTPVHSSANENNHIMKAGPGRLYNVTASNATASAGFLIVLDTATVPSTGTVAPILCRALPASGTATISFYPTPPALFSTGIVALVTSASVCTTYTTGVITAWFDGMLQ